MSGRPIVRGGAARGGIVRRWLGAVVLGAGALAASGLASAGPAPRASAVAFDALFARLDALPRIHDDHADRQADYRRLHALLPSGDAARALRYEALRCGSGLYDDPARVAAAAAAHLEQARRLGDADAQVRLLYCRGDALELQRDERAALVDYGRGIELARRTGLPRLLGEGLSLRAASQSMLGEQARALIDLMAAQQVYERAGLYEFAYENLLGLGTAYRRMGEFDRALAHLRRAERAGRERRDWQTVYTALLQQGYLHYDRDDGAASLVPLRQALELAEREGFARDAALARIALAASHTLIGEPANALRHIDRAQQGLDALGGRSGAGMLLDLRRGEALAGLGRHREALARYARARTALAGSDNLRYRLLLHRAHAASFEALGRMHEALAEYRHALQAQTELDRIGHGQAETLMRHQFDLGRREAEHRRLVAETSLHEQQLQAGRRVRRWQHAALAAGAGLALVLAGLGLRQRRRGRRLHALAMTDPLTGAANRRSLERFADRAIADARPPARPVSVVALDIDHFKRINDRHGHAVGDDVLRRVAGACQRELRRCDLLGRTGGEEFVAVLPGTSLAAAQQVAQRLLAGIGTLALDSPGADLRITASLGVAEFSSADADFRRLLQRADAALYRAKHNGRNRIECDDGSVDAGIAPAASAPAEAGPAAASAPAPA